MNKVHYLPWIGKDYPAGGIFSQKILVLGESHYTDEEKGSDFTRNVVSDYLNPEKRDSWMPTFLKFERSLVGHVADQKERAAIWNSVAFYNYLQETVSGPREKGRREMYEQSKAPFFQVLNELRPDMMIVWGYRLWNNLPGEKWQDGQDIYIDDYKVLQGAYILEDGTPVKVVCVYHPAAGYSWDYWHRVIKSVMELDSAQRI